MTKKESDLKRKILGSLYRKMKFPEKQSRQIEITEKFNIQNARRLLLSDIIDLDGKKKLKKYLSNFEGDTLQVIYESDDYGKNLDSPDLSREYDTFLT